MSTPSTRIRIAFATSGSQAVVFRQGPSRWTRMLAWCTRTDKITPGQWIRGKIRHFAINGDASLVLVNVQSYRRRPHDVTYDSPWIALSQPPWFSALAVWHIGDTWGGQCGFMSDQKVYIGAGMQPIRIEGKLDQEMEWTSDSDHLHWRREQFPGGWNSLPGDDGKDCGHATKRSDLSSIEVRRKWLKGNWQMELYRIQGKNRQRITTLNDVFFGDFDSDGRFVFTRCNGIIYRVSLEHGDLNLSEICDLSAMKPEPVVPEPNVTIW